MSPFYTPIFTRELANTNYRIKKDRELKYEKVEGEDLVFEEETIDLDGA
jgi:hypothetical protein